MILPAIALVLLSSASASQISQIFWTFLNDSSDCKRSESRLDFIASSRGARSGNPTFLRLMVSTVKTIDPGGVLKINLIWDAWKMLEKTVLFEIYINFLPQSSKRFSTAAIGSCQAMSESPTKWVIALELLASELMGQVASTWQFIGFSWLSWVFVRDFLSFLIAFLKHIDYRLRKLF